MTTVNPETSGACCLPQLRKEIAHKPTTTSDPEPGGKRRALTVALKLFVTQAVDSLEQQSVCLLYRLDGAHVVVAVQHAAVSIRHVMLCV